MKKGLGGLKKNCVPSRREKHKAEQPSHRLLRQRLRLGNNETFSAARAREERKRKASIGSVRFFRIKRRTKEEHN